MACRKLRKPHKHCMHIITTSTFAELSLLRCCLACLGSSRSNAPHTICFEGRAFLAWVVEAKLPSNMRNAKMVETLLLIFSISDNVKLWDLEGMNISWKVQFLRGKFFKPLKAPIVRRAQQYSWSFSSLCIYWIAGLGLRLQLGRRKLLRKKKKCSSWRRGGTPYTHRYTTQASCLAVCPPMDKGSFVDLNAGSQTSRWTGSKDSRFGPISMGRGGLRR